VSCLLHHFRYSQSLVTVNILSPCSLKLLPDAIIQHGLISRKYIRKSTHVASTLHIILPSKGIYSGGFLSNLSCNQCKICQGGNICWAGYMLCNSHSINNRSIFSFCIHSGKFSDHISVNTGNQRYRIRGIVNDWFFEFFIAFSSVSYKIIICQAFRHYYIKHTVYKGKIASRF